MVVDPSLTWRVIWDATGTVNDAVVRYGEAPGGPQHYGEVSFLGLDETVFLRQAPYYQTQFTTSIVHVGNGRLLDVVSGRGQGARHVVERSGRRRALKHQGR